MRAYDRGTPSYDDLKTFTISITDKDDNPPYFDRDAFPPPYEVTVLEENINLRVVDLNIASDPDSGNNSRICYYIVGKLPMLSSV